MMKPVRRIAAVIYLVMIIVVLAIAIAVGKCLSSLSLIIRFELIIAVAAAAESGRTRAFPGLNPVSGRCLVRYLRSIIGG